MNRENEYIGILDALTRIKSEIITESTEELAMTGMMPEQSQKELKVLIDITGAVFGGFHAMGIPVSDVGKVVSVTIGGRDFTCPKGAVKFDTADIKHVDKPIVNQPVKEEAPIVETPIVDKDEPTVNSNPVNSNPIVEEKEEVSEPTLETVETSKETITPDPVEMVSEAEDIDLNDDDDEIDFEGLFDDNETSDETSITEEDTVSEEVSDAPTNINDFVDSMTSNLNEEEAPVSNEPDYMQMLKDTGYDKPIETEKEEPTYNSTYNDEDDTEEEEDDSTIPNIQSGMNFSNFFVEEQNKDAAGFVYSFSKISIMHTDRMGGGHPEEMYIMVAPLSIYKQEISSVPIVVTIVHNGKHVTCSSYDTLDEGKNIVLIDIDEFYFLCRGSFTADGKFRATVVTTGISAAQGDKMNILSSKTYGNALDPETKNGHIKFSYKSEAGDGYIEVIPFGKPGDEDFVAIVKNKEFIDYYLMSKSLRANSKAIVYSKGGISNELLCHWDGDILMADLI